MNTSEVPAGFWIRVLAAVVDTAVVVALAWGLGLILIRTIHPVEVQEQMIYLYFSLSCLYNVLSLARWGATPGKRALGIRIVRATDLSRISLRQSALRWLGYSLSNFIFGAGYLMAAFHPRKRALHDLFAGTCAVRTIRGAAFAPLNT